MRKTTFVTLSLLIFTILILFANTYSVRPSADAKSDVYGQVLIPRNNVTTNFPQQQLPIADPATAADIVTQYQIPSAAILPSQQQLPIADPATAC